MNKDQELEYLVEKYSDTILRLSYSYLKNLQDAQDITQNVFVKLYTTNYVFKNSEHEKAFILRMTINSCKDLLKNSWKNKICDFEISENIVTPNFENENSILWAVNQLDEKYRMIIHLHYYEGYKASEISKITGITIPTVYTRLIRGRELLKHILEEEKGEENYGPGQI